MVLRTLISIFNNCGQVSDFFFSFWDTVRVGAEEERKWEGKTGEREARREGGERKGGRGGRNLGSRRKEEESLAPG